MASFEEGTKGEISCAVVAKVRQQSKFVGIALFEKDRKVFKVCEFQDNDHLSILESVLLQTHPKHCFYVAAPVLAKKTKEILASCDVAAEEGKQASFRADNVEQDLARLLQTSVKSHLQELSWKIAMECVEALVERHRLLSNEENFRQCRLTPHPVGAFMRLDKASFSALQILPRPGDGVRVPTSVLGFLNRCRTAVGSRRLVQWVTQPLVDGDELSRRHDIVELFVGNEPFRQNAVNRFLSSVPDLDRLAARFHQVAASGKGTGAGLEDMVRTYQTLLNCDRLHKQLQQYDGPFKVSLDELIMAPMRQVLTDSGNFFQLVEQTIDLEQAAKGTYVISCAFEPAFGALMQRKKQLWTKVEQIQQKAQDTLRTSGAKDGVRVVEAPNSKGWALRVTKKSQKAVQARKEFKTVQLNKAEFLFTTTALERVVAQIMEIDRDYEAQQETLVRKALQVASTYYPCLERLAGLYASLDVLITFALVSSSSKGTFVRAKIDPTGKTLDLRGSRHVLVEEVTDGSFIKNDAVMDREKSRMFVITGPNMGGKSTYIRQVALCALFNQVGCFVPAESATLPLFSSVMCRVGASDLQLRGVSTFMAEMLEASCILDTADERSLVLVDELGRGTSTYDGFGLAWAIADFLCSEVKCFTLFATHFHELSALQDSRGCVLNKHVRAMVQGADKLTFLYEVREGFADQSYGVHVAEMAKFPADVIRTAKRKAEELEEGSRRANKRFCSDGTAPGLAGLLQLKEALALPDKGAFLQKVKATLPLLRSALNAA